jgi:peroxiredoxin
MKRLLSILFVTLLWSVFPAQAQMANPGPTWERQGAALRTIDFSIPMQGISDMALTFKRFQGKPTLIYYFSSRCPHCKASYPKIEEIQRAFAARGLNTVMIASGRNEKADLRQFMTELKVSLPVLQDHEAKFTRTYNVPTVPMAFLVTQRGQVIRYTNVHSELGYLRAEIERLLPRQAQQLPPKR